MATNYTEYEIFANDYEAYLDFLAEVSAENYCEYLETMEAERE